MEIVEGSNQLFQKCGKRYESGLAMTFFAMIRDGECRLLQRVAVNRSETQVPLARRCRKQGYKGNLG